MNPEAEVQPSAPAAATEQPAAPALPKEFDAAAHAAKRLVPKNDSFGRPLGDGKTPPPAAREARVLPASEEKKPVPGAPEAPPEEKSNERKLINERNKLRDRIAFLEGENKTYKELLREGMTPKAAAAAVSEQPVRQPGDEPVRSDYQTDADFTRALAEYTSNKTVAAAQQQQEWARSLNERKIEADQILEEHAALIPDFSEKILPALNELKVPDGPEAAQIVELFATSHYRAELSEHFAAHPEDWDKWVNAEGTPRRDQFRAGIAGTNEYHRALGEFFKKREVYFAKLEGRAEAVYNNRLEAAKSTGTSQDAARVTTRQTATTDGGNQPIRQLPRPSSEVGPKGGAAPVIPDKPKPGTKEMVDMKMRRLKPYLFNRT